MTASGPPGPEGGRRPYEGLPIRIEHLTKTFGTTRAVDDLSFTVEPGVVTGFLGPNGAGKTTTLRCLLGLVAPTSGTATVGGRPYADLDDPVGTVGAALEASDFHPGRTARAHLEVVALAAGRPRELADDLLTQVGLHEVGDRRVGGFSLGMRQRLALATALLGDPRVLVLDEPANGLDPAGIAWLRGFLRSLAHQGRTVLVSSHVLTEVQQTVDRVVLLSRGRLVYEGSLAGMGGGALTVRVRTPAPALLHDLLTAAGARFSHDPEDSQVLLVTDRSPAEVGSIAFTGGVELHELSSRGDDLESVFLGLTREVQQ